MSREIYEQEVSRAAKAEMAYNTFIRDFIEQKKFDLFNRFAEANPLTDTGKEELFETRRMCAVVTSLEQEILSVIQTGELAKKSLAQLDKLER